MFFSMTQKINNELNSNNDVFHIANKYYNLAHSEVFQQELDLEYDIKYRISKNFSLPLNTIKVVGSAHIGSSPFKKKIFVKSHSDLDISIIEQGLFNYYLNIILVKTKNYTDLTYFYTNNEQTVKNFRYKVSRGILDFTYLKNLSELDEFDKFFRHLSNDYFEWFKNINARIYLSETCMILKQMDNIKEIKNDKV